MNPSKIPPRLVTGILLAVIFAIALFIRVYLPYHDIFSGDWIKYSNVDAYFYMRLVENLVHNFPHANAFDPYFIYPSGGWTGHISLFAWLLAGVTWLIGLGSPSQHLIELVGAYFPAILGALTVIPVYFLGKAVFGRWTGLIAAALIAILPGEWLLRSTLGYTDQHVAETLFTTTALLFLVLAIKAAGEAGLTFVHLSKRDRAALTRPLVYALLGGVFLGIYFLTWQGAPLFVFIIVTFFVVQFIIDHLRQKSTDYLCIIEVVFFLAAIIVFRPFLIDEMLQASSLLMALVVPLVMSALSRLMANRQLKPVYYPGALFVSGLAALAIVGVARPALLNSLLGQFSIFAPAPTLQATAEAQSFFSFGFYLPWSNFTTGFFFSLAALGILVYQVIKHGSAEKSLLAVWSLIILLATLSQRRFAYYFAVDVAILTGFLAWQLIWISGLNRLKAEPVKAVTESSKRRPKQGKAPQKSPSWTTARRNIIVGISATLLLVFPLNIPQVLSTVKILPVPSDAWYGALTWMKTNTPEPFGNPDFYYRSYQAPPGLSYPYPDTAYGVTSWWDNGYWITSVAHRLPNTNPSQAAGPLKDAGRLFLSQNETATREIMQKFNSSYVIIDHDMATSKFWSFATWAGMGRSEFSEGYYLPEKKAFVQVYYPAYYKSLVSRLYNFDGKAVAPQLSIVIGYDEKRGPTGAYREITSQKPFSSYIEALNYLQDRSKSGRYQIVGSDPFNSPVPLEALASYKLVFKSDETSPRSDKDTIPQVKIFEYTGNATKPSR